ncbi:MAG: alanine racemase [Actinomycetota bacterium]|nr:alanine racemase [Actinomycetota bacterium]
MTGGSNVDNSGIEVLERYRNIAERILSMSSGRTELLAVSKTVSVDRIASLVEGGVLSFGENYSNELIEKANDIRLSSVSWHMIGPLQRRSIPKFARFAAVIQSVGRLAELDSLAKVNFQGEIYLQVDCAVGGQRNGFLTNEVEGALLHAQSLGNSPVGLMTVAPNTDRSGRRDCFSQVASIAKDLGLAKLSMGMSDDYEDAIEFGSTLVRLGRSIFGERPSK